MLTVLEAAIDRALSQETLGMVLAEALEKLVQIREQCAAMRRAGLERGKRLFMRDVLG